MISTEMVSRCIAAIARYKSIEIDRVMNDNCIPVHQPVVSGDSSKVEYLST